MKKLINENWFKIGILIIGIGIIYTLQISSDSNTKIEPISALEYKELNDECEKYGLEKWGDKFEIVGNVMISRKYKYSMVMNTCVMKVTETAKDWRAIELRDIYFDKNIISYDLSCIHLGNPDECTSMGDILDKEQEIWK